MPESKKFTILTPYNIPPFKNKNDLIFAIFGLLTLEMAILGQNLGPCPRALVMDLGWIFLLGLLMCVSFTTLCMPMAYFDSILVTRLTVDFNRENGGLVFQPFLDFRVEIFTEDGHFLAISVFIIVTGLKPQNKKQFGVRLYRQFWEKFIDMSQKFVDEYRECQY